MKEKKIYDAAELEVIRLDSTDIIMTSGENPTEEEVIEEE